VWALQLHLDGDADAPGGGDQGGCQALGDEGARGFALEVGV
jgi:hypothetical protein